MFYIFVNITMSPLKTFTLQVERWKLSTSVCREPFVTEKPASSKNEHLKQIFA